MLNAPIDLNLTLHVRYRAYDLPQRIFFRFYQRLASHTFEPPSQHTVFIRKAPECCILPLYFASRCASYVDAAHEYFDLQSGSVPYTKGIEDYGPRPDPWQKIVTQMGYPETDR